MVTLNAYGAGIDCGGTPNTAGSPFSASNALKAVLDSGASRMRLQILWYSIERAVQTTSSTAVSSAGSHTITLASVPANFTVGTQILVDVSGHQQETVTIQAIGGSTITATFAKTHTVTPYPVAVIPLAGDTPASSGSPARVQAYDWSIVDDYVSTCQANGIAATFVTQNAPPWHVEALAIDPGKMVAKPTDTANFLTDLFAHLQSTFGAKNQFFALEVANEGFNSNLLTSGNAPSMFAQMLTFLQATQPIIKANSPTTLVGAPADLNSASDNINTWIPGFFNATCHEYVDYLNFHFYPRVAPDSPDAGHDGLQDWLAAWQSALSTYGSNLPIWITEWGWTMINGAGTNGGISDPTYDLYQATVFSDARESQIVQALYQFDLDSIVRGINFNNATTLQTYKDWKAQIAAAPQLLRYTPLTLYLSNAASTAQPLAKALYTLSGSPGTANSTSSLGTAIGFGEIPSTGSASPWPSFGAIGAPTGHGWAWDAGTLTGQQFRAGQWSATIRLLTTGTDAGTLTADLQARIYQYTPSTGTYTRIATLTLPGQTITPTAATFVLLGTTVAPTAFTSLDHVYVDVWANVTANSGGAGQQIRLPHLSTDSVNGTGLATAQIATPGYQVATGGGGGGSALTMSIGGNAVTFLEETFQLDYKLGERWQASCTVIDESGTAFFHYGEQVIITDSSLGTLFVGYISDDHYDKQHTYPGTPVEHQITCMDNRYLADKRTSNLLYTTPTPAGKIVTDLVDRVLASEGVIASYATQTTATDAAWNSGTLTNVAAPKGTGEGDLELTPAAGSFTTSILARADWASNGTLTNVRANGGGNLSLIGETRNWDNRKIAGQTLYGQGRPTQKANPQGVYVLSCTGYNETRARMDWAGTWGDGTITVDMQVFSTATANSLVYRTRHWNDNDHSYAYAIELTQAGLVLRKGTDGGRGPSSPLASATFSPTLAKGWYTVQVATSTTSGQVHHQISVDGSQYIDYTDTSSPYTAAGYIGMRNRNRDSWTNSMLFDNFGVVATPSGTWISDSQSLSGIATIADSVIEWDESLSQGGTVTVQASTNNGASYADCTSGSVIPGLTPGTPGSGLKLRIQITLAVDSSGVMPAIQNLSWRVQSGYVLSGSRVSDPFVLAPAGVCGTAVMSWNADLPTNTTLGMDVSPDGATWYDMSEQNGGALPFITGTPEPTTDGFETDTSANYVILGLVIDGDSFANRTVGSGWGTASSGLTTWNNSTGSSTTGVSGGNGTIAASASTTIFVGTSDVSDGVFTVQVAVGDATNDTALLLARYQDANNYDALVLQGQILSLQSVVGGVATTLARSMIANVAFVPRTLGGTITGKALTNSGAITAGMFYWLQFTLSGPTLSGKIWQDGTGEPAADQITATDSTSTAGTYGLGGNASTSTPIRFNSYSVSSIVPAWTYETALSRILSAGSASLYLNGAISAGNVSAMTILDQSDGGGLCLNALDRLTYYTVVATDNQAVFSSANTVTLAKTTSAGGTSTPCSLWLSAQASTTLSTANQLYTVQGNPKLSASISTIGNNVTGWGEVTSQGSATWAASGSIGAPTGHGFVFDAPLLEGNSLIAGNYSATIRLNASQGKANPHAGTLGGDIAVRAYKRSSGGTYTAIWSTTLTGQTLSSTPATFVISGSGSLTSFAAGDKLYIDLWFHCTTNANSTASQGVCLNRLSLDHTGQTGASHAVITTPGYQASSGVVSVTSTLQTASISFPRGTYHTLSATMNNDTITVRFDGAQVVSYQDSNALGVGQVGLYSNGGSLGARFYYLWIQPQGDDLTNVQVYTRQRLATTDATVTPQVLDLTVAAFAPQIGAGALIPSANYQRTFCDKNIDDLAKQSGYEWWIDQNFVLNFTAREGTPSPWCLQSGLLSDIEIDSQLQATVSGDQYRNRQVLTNVTNSGIFTDMFVGDGQRTSFTLRYPIAPGTTPKVTLTGVRQKIGLKGGRTRQWYYSENDPTIAEDSNGVTLTLSDTLSVKYTGIFTTTVIANNVAAQAALAAIEQSSGIVEAVEDVSQKQMTYAAALVYAQALLDRYCVVDESNAPNGLTLTFTTYRNGLSVGQLLPVFLPELHLQDRLLLIHEIQVGMQTQPHTTVLYHYQVTASLLPRVKSFPALLAANLLH